MGGEKAEAVARDTTVLCATFVAWNAVAQDAVTQNVAGDTMGQLAGVAVGQLARDTAVAAQDAVVTTQYAVRVVACVAMGHVTG